MHIQDIINYFMPLFIAVLTSQLYIYIYIYRCDLTKFRNLRTEPNDYVSKKVKLLLNM